jgi:hypothetical protein
MEGRIQIFFQKDQVQNVQLLLLKLTKNPASRMQAADQQEEVFFKFAKGVTILSAEVLGTRFVSSDPHEPQPIVVDQQKITIIPALLRAEDTVVIKTLFSPFETDLVIDSCLRKKERFGPRAKLLIGVALLVFVLFLLGIGTSLTIWLHPTSIFKQNWFILVNNALSYRFGPVFFV